MLLDAPDEAIVSEPEGVLPVLVVKAAVPELKVYEAVPVLMVYGAVPVLLG